MTLKELIEEATRIGYQLSSASIPVKIDGEETEVKFRIHYDANNQLYVAMEVWKQ